MTRTNLNPDNEPWNSPQRTRHVYRQDDGKLVDVPPSDWVDYELIDVTLREDPPDVHVYVRGRRMR